MVHAALEYITGGRGLVDPMRSEAGYKDYAKRNGNGTLVDQSTRFKGDGKLTFDRLTDVFHSGTRHEEDQPSHLKVRDLDICSSRCVEENRKPVPVFCRRGGVRDGERGRWIEIEDQRGQLRALQDLRHCRPLPDY